MSTQRFMPRICKGSGHFAFAIILGALLALQCLLPAATFARTTGRGSAFSSLSAHDQTQENIREKVGISVVRLVVTYGNSDIQNQTITCTGLGFLIGNKLTVGAGGSANLYENWVLTDGNLLNRTTANCNTLGTSKDLKNIQILANDEYTSKPSLGYMLGDLSCMSPNGGPVLCTGAGPLLSAIPGAFDVFPAQSTATLGFATLFSFYTTTLEPCLTPNFAVSSTSLLTTIGLANRVGQFPTNPTTITEAKSYLNPTLIPPDGSASVSAQATSTGTSVAATPTPSAPSAPEAGTPVVDGNGAVVGLYLSTGTEFDLSQVNVDNTKLPPLDTSNDLKTNWDAGMDAYHAGQYQQADAAFKALLKLKIDPKFQAAQTFDTLAEQKLTPTPLATATTPASTKKGQASGTSLDANSANWLLIGLLAGLFVLIVLLVWVTVKMGRVRRRQRELEKFAQEQEAARQIAESELQRQRVQPQPGEAPCPNCHQFVRLTDAVCPHCRYPLSPSASGLNVRLVAPAPLPPGPAMVSSAPPPLPISEQPTVQFLPNQVATAANHDTSGEKTVKRSKHVQPDETLLDVQQMRGRNLGLTVGTRSDPGIKRKHKPNEDSMFAMQGARTHNDQPQQFGLFVIADGMGGHANGQNASRLAIQTIIDFLLPRISTSDHLSDEGYKQLLSDGVQSANQAVHSSNLEEHADMGTTMTGTLIIGSIAYVANVGDSRTYLYRQGEGLSKVTHDHSVVASLVDAGIIQEDDIYTHPKRNQIYRSLGEKPIVEVDTFQVELQPGDKMLLCSDGLWDMVRDPMIQQLLSKPVVDPDKTGQDLIKAAFQGGGEDNVTVIVIQFAEINERTAISGIRLLAKPDNVTLPPMP